MAFRVVLMAAIAAALAFAQPPRGFYPWWDRPIAKTLNLSDAQAKQVRSTIRDYRGKLIDARAALEKAEVELEAALDEENIDQRRANQAVDDLAKARENLTRAFAQMAIQLRSALTPQQWQELQKRRAEQESPMGRRPQAQRRGQQPPPPQQ
jgi:Spy/CpxP family protein refolding chaperone